MRCKLDVSGGVSCDSLCGRLRMAQTIGIMNLDGLIIR
jgi:hypothetical protein